MLLRKGIQVDIAHQFQQVRNCVVRTEFTRWNDKNKTDISKTQGIKSSKTETGYPLPVILASN
jgi:hypothetical protein